MSEICPEASGSFQPRNKPKSRTPERCEDIPMAIFQHYPPLQDSEPICRDEGPVDINFYEAESKKKEKLRVNVYIIITLQLLVTVAIVAPFLFNDNTREFMKNEYPVPLNTIRVAGTIALTTFLVLSFFDQVRQSFPINMILLATFTVAMGTLLGMSAAHRDPIAVLGGFAIALLVCVVDVVATTCYHMTLPLKCGTMLMIEVVGVIALFSYLMIAFGGVFELLLTIGVFLVVSQGTSLVFDIQNARGVRKRDDVTEVLILYSDMMALFLLMHLVWTDMARLV